jgi:hypothetical protein
MEAERLVGDELETGSGVEAVIGGKAAMSGSSS